MDAYRSGLGLRHCDERRQDDRRHEPRRERERRHGDRRRAGLRTLLLTAAALTAPHAARLQALRAPVKAVRSALGFDRAAATVSVSVDSFEAVPARHAYDDIIADAAARYHLDPAMIKAVMQTESAFNAMAVSRVGALGLMQLMPAVAREHGAEDPMDPRQNIMAGAEYLKQLLTAHNGNIKLALASYNAGPGAVARYRRIPPFKETQNYVKRVTALLENPEPNP